MMRSWLARDEHGNLVDVSLDDTGGEGGAGVHTHDDYAASGHTHAAEVHTHAYAPEQHAHGSYADSGHSHDTSHSHADYADTSHTHAAGDHPDLATHTSLGLAAAHSHDFAATGHNHDAAYAATHAHPYSVDTHDHDADYSAAGHGHVHDHNGTYEPVHSGHAHSHTAADVGAAADDHTHDTSHTHDLSAYATDADLTAHAATSHGGGDGVPAGVIVMWAGSVAQIPSGWALCDGQNGTPDLSDRFIKGTTGTPGTTGGAATHAHGDHSGVLAHDHTVTDPGHTHVETNNSATTGPNAGWGARDTSTNTQTATGYSTASATTGVSVDSAGSGATYSHDAVNHEPAFFTLAFIQKV